MSSPKAPPPPDYAAATTAGVQADADTLPFRLAISQAAQLGTKYTDPDTGREYDFTGLGLDAAADLVLRAERDRLQSELELLPQFNQLNLDQQRAALDLALEMQPRIGESQRAEDELTWRQNLRLGQEGTRAFTDLQEELMPRLSAMSEEAAGRAFSANLAQADEAGARAAGLQQRLLPGLNDLQLRLQGDAVDAANVAARRNNESAYQVRDALGLQLASDLAAGNDLTDAQRNRVQQDIRRSQAARGNILGDGAAFDEAIASSDLAERIAQERKTNALSFINSRDLAPSFASMGVVNPTQVVTPNNAPAQPVNPLLPNNPSATAPAFSATTTSGPNLTATPAATLNPNAGANGANYAAGVWQTQANNAAQQQNPWMTGLGLVTGTALGGITGGAVNAINRRIFGAG